MRTIKFRAWDRISGKWLNDFDISCNGLVVFPNIAREEYNQDDFLIQQFTGLLDRHGKEIYEGDIVRYDQKPTSWAKTGGALLSVIWVEQYAHFKLKMIESYGDVVNSDYAVDALNKYSEVIGNIYENPELIKDLI